MRVKFILKIIYIFFFHRQYCNIFAILSLKIPQILKVQRNRELNKHETQVPMIVKGSQLYFCVRELVSNPMSNRCYASVGFMQPYQLV